MPGLRRLLAVMERLRDPEHGCPWDRAQTPASIAPWTIEEACEVAEAAETGDVAHWQEELGDLLFHVVFHARLAEEAGEFGFDAVAAAAASKLEQRHPHVFAGTGIPADADFNHQWEREKAARRTHIDERLPIRLPALMRAHKLQKRAAAVGFDWPDADGAHAKIREELDELGRAVAARQAGSGTGAADHVREEVGDLLFAVVNYARHLGIDPEQALRGANRKFTRRFTHIEARLAEQGLDPDDVDLTCLDQLWNEAKAREQG